jgi:hypothetical protein
VCVHRDDEVRGPDADPFGIHVQAVKVVAVFSMATRDATATSRILHVAGEGRAPVDEAASPVSHTLNSGSARARFTRRLMASASMR